MVNEILPIEEALKLIDLLEVQNQVQLRQDRQETYPDAWPEAQQLIEHMGKLMVGAVPLAVEQTRVSTDLVRRAYRIIEKAANPAQAKQAREVDAQRWLIDFHKEFKVEDATTGAAVSAPAKDLTGLPPHLEFPEGTPHTLTSIFEKKY